MDIDKLIAEHASRLKAAYETADPDVPTIAAGPSHSDRWRPQRSIWAFAAGFVAVAAISAPLVLGLFDSGTRPQDRALAPPTTAPADAPTLEVTEVPGVPWHSLEYPSAVVIGAMNDDQLAVASTTNGVLWIGSSTGDNWIQHETPYPISEFLAYESGLAAVSYDDQGIATVIVSGDGETWDKEKTFDRDALGAPEALAVIPPALSEALPEYAVSAVAEGSNTIIVGKPAGAGVGGGPGIWYSDSAEWSKATISLPADVTFGDTPGEYWMPDGLLKVTISDLGDYLAWGPLAIVDDQDTIDAGTLILASSDGISWTGEVVTDDIEQILAVEDGFIAFARATHGTTSVLQSETGLGWSRLGILDMDFSRATVLDEHIAAVGTTGDTSSKPMMALVEIKP